MKARLVKYFCLIAVIAMAMPAVAQDYVTVYLKDQKAVNFRTDNIIDMRVQSMPDGNGSFVDYHTIQTNDSLFKCPVAMVDSIRFAIAAKVEETMETTSTDICSIISSFDDIVSIKEALQSQEAALSDMDGVSHLDISDFSCSITYSNGKEDVYLYDTESPYDVSDSGSEAKRNVSDNNVVLGRRKISHSKDDVPNSDAVFFDIFSNSPKRREQSEMMKKAANLFSGNTYLDENGNSKYYSVCYLSEFNEELLAEALVSEKVKYIFVSTHGDYGRLATNEYHYPDPNPVPEWEGRIYSAFEGVYYRAFKMKDIITNYTNNMGGIKGQKLMYFASCSAGKDNPFWCSNAYVLGWNGVNYGGQAMGLILADYIANFKLGVQAFKDDFRNINDPTDKISTARLVANGNSEIGERSHTAPYNSLMDIDDEFDCCTVGLDYSDPITIRTTDVDYAVDLTAKITKKAWSGRPMYNDQPFDIYFNTSADAITNTKDFSGYYGWNQIPFEQIPSWGSYKFQTRVFPGVNRLILNLSNQDVTIPSAVRYYIVEHNVGSNGGSEEPEYDDSVTPEVITLEPEVSDNSVILHGIVANMSGQLVKKGFVYWKQGEAGETTQTIMSEDESNNYYAKLSDLAPGSYYAQAFTLAKEIKEFGAKVEFTIGGSVQPTDHEYVDLGLSVKWATCNVGANSPEEYGDYFAWGETKPKDVYNWSTYKWCDGSSNTMTKYCIDSSCGTVDNNTTLELADDAARANWGGSWRMPTRAEQDELREKCTWTWTSQNGKNGYKVTSKINGNSIFLPAAGCCYEGSLYDAGSLGDYWSSSLGGSSSYRACCLDFNSVYVDWHDYYRHYYSLSVRAVCP